MENETPAVQPAASSQLLKKEKTRLDNKKFIIVVLVLVVVAGVLFSCRSLFVAALVDGHPISRLSLVQKLEQQSGKNVLDMVITEQLIKQEAEMKGITISDEKVNEEIKKIEESIKGQGSTLAEALEAQGLSEANLRDQLKIQKTVEQLLADKLEVTDEEVDKFITDNKMPVPKDKEAETKTQVKDQLRGQKLNQEAGLLVSQLKEQAKIKYYVDYK